MGEGEGQLDFILYLKEVKLRLPMVINFLVLKFL